jgi:HD-like signal output (HDOD) protein
MGQMSAPLERLRDRLRAFLQFIKPRLLVEGVRLDRLPSLRRRAEEILRSGVMGRPLLDGRDLCEILSGGSGVRFDLLAEETGLLPPSCFREPLVPLGEDMSLLKEAVVTLDLVGEPALRRHASEFAAQQGVLPVDYLPPPTPRPSPAPMPPLPPAVDALLGRFGTLWTVPGLVHKILDMLDAPETPPAAVCLEIERDAELSDRLLRLVHAVSAGRAPRAGSIRQALASRPAGPIRRLVSIAALAAPLSHPSPDAAPDLREGWRHAFLAAHGGCLVSEASGLGDPDEGFDAGLLHAVGRLAVIRHLLPEYRRLQAEVRAAGTPWTAAERRLLGVTSAEVAACLCGRWRLPDALEEAVRRQSDPPDTLSTSGAPRAAVVLAALLDLLQSPQDAGRRARGSRLLGVPEDRLSGLLEQAARLAAVSLAEFFPT